MLKALMEYVGDASPEYLNGFSLVKSDIETPGVRQPFYFCLGRHDFFLVPAPSKEITSPASEEGEATQRSLKNVLVVSYRAIVEVLKREDEVDSMTIVLGPGTLKRYKHATSTTPRTPLSAINVFCGERQALLTELVVCLKASHMFFTFEIHTDDVVRPVRAEKSLLSDLIISKPAGHNPAAKEQELVDKFWRTSHVRERTDKYSIQGCTFYAPGDFKERITAGMNKRFFHRPAKRDSDALELGQIKIREGVEDAALTIEQVDPTGERLLPIQRVAERKMRDLCSAVQDWRLRGRPSAYQKRMNLTGDPAAWTCWCIRLRTLKGRSGGNSLQIGHPESDPRALELRNVTIIACRRNFIPPTMQSHTDFVVTYVSQYEDFNDVEADETCQLIVDTLSPSTSVYERDDLVVKATADALLLDDPSYFWYESELRVRPKAHAKAREFCRALFDVLSDRTAVWNETQKVMFAQIVQEAESQFAPSNSGNGMSSNGMMMNSSSSSRVLGSSKSAMLGAANATSKRSLGADSPRKPVSSSSSRGLDAAGQGQEESCIARAFRAAEELEAMAPGLDPETETNKADWVAWRIRVWRYLAFCADGALYKDALNLEHLCRALKSPTTDKEARQALSKILDKFIHLRQTGEDYKPDELHQKASSERFMSACTFNERVLAKLLRKETGYVQAALSAYDLNLYPKFLVRLLCRDDQQLQQQQQSQQPHQARGWLSDSFGGALSDSYDPAEPIAHAVLKSLVVQSSQPTLASSSSSTSSTTSSALVGEDRMASSSAVASLSGEDRAYDIALNVLVPALIRVFMSHPEDDKLRTFVVAILVNFSRNNYSVKANILAGGFAREIVKLLRSKDDDLVRHACSLLTNLTKTTDFRATIYRGSAKASLLELISKNATAASVASLPDADKYRAPKIVAQACQVLGNLAIDPTTRGDLLRGEEVQHDADGNYAISIVVRTLADLVFKEDYVATFKRTGSRSELDDVRASALFALKNLSISAPASQFSSSSSTSQSQQGGEGGVANNSGSTSSSAGGGGARTSVKSALGRYASKAFLRLLKDRDLKDRNLIDYLLRLLYSLCYEPKVAIKLHAERISEGLALRKQDFANLCLQIQTKIAQQQKHASQGLSNGNGGGGNNGFAPMAAGGGGGPGEEQADVTSAAAITGGILKPSRFRPSAEQ